MPNTVTYPAFSAHGFIRGAWVAAADGERGVVWAFVAVAGGVWRGVILCFIFMAPAMNRWAENAQYGCYFQPRGSTFSAHSDESLGRKCQIRLLFSAQGFNIFSPRVYPWGSEPPAVLPSESGVSPGMGGCSGNNPAVFSGNVFSVVSGMIPFIRSNHSSSSAKFWPRWCDFCC